VPSPVESECPGGSVEPEGVRAGLVDRDPEVVEPRMIEIVERVDALS
jgi:hypothetical protein